ncbi:transposase [Streptomyces sp. 769]|nr:transposase [Streptomyces sp. 769]
MLRDHGCALHDEGARVLPKSKVDLYAAIRCDSPLLGGQPEYVRNRQQTPSAGQNGVTLTGTSRRWCSGYR